MSTDHCCKRSSSGIQVERVHVVDDVEVHSRKLDDLSFRESLRPGLAVNIPANGGDRRDLFQCGNNLRRADVSGMDDVFRFVKGSNRLWSQEAVSVRDHADYHGLVLSLISENQPHLFDLW